MNRKTDLLLATALAVAVAALAVSLGQTTLYHNDGHRLLTQLVRGELDIGRHHLSLPVMTCFHRVVGEPLGWMPYRSLTVLGALATGVAVALTFASFRRLGEARVAALVASVAFAASFPVLYFATLVEFHALFLPWAMLAFWFAAGCIAAVRRGGSGWWQALAAGATAGLASQFHSMGVFLSPLFALLLLVECPAASWWRRVRGGALSVVTTVAVFFAFLVFWRSLDWQVRGAFAMPREGLELVWFVVGRLPGYAFTEFAVGLLPWSVVVVAALAARRHRWLALAVLVAMLPYVLSASIILAITEYGAYLAPLAAPAALLTVRWLGVRWTLALAVGVGAVGVAVACVYDTEQQRYRSFAAGLLDELDGGRGALIYCENPHWQIDEHVDEWAAVCTYAPLVDTFEVQTMAGKDGGEPPPPPPVIRAALGAHFAGARLFLGAGSHARLRTMYVSGQVVLDVLQQAYEFVPKQRGGFEGFELVPR